MSQSGKPQTWLGGLVNAIENVFAHEVWPWFQALFHSLQLDAISQLKPLAIEAAEEVLAELPEAFSDPEKFIHDFNATVAKTWQKAEAAALKVAQTDILAAVHAAVTHATQKVKPPA